MRGDVVAAAARDPLQRGLEPVVRERLDLAAVRADEMVVVIGRVRALEARDPVSGSTRCTSSASTRPSTARYTLAIPMRAPSPRTPS